MSEFYRYRFGSCGDVPGLPDQMPGCCCPACRGVQVLRGRRAKVACQALPGRRGWPGQQGPLDRPALCRKMPSLPLWGLPNSSPMGISCFGFRQLKIPPAVSPSQVCSIFSFLLAII